MLELRESVFAEVRRFRQDCRLRSGLWLLVCSFKQSIPATLPKNTSSQVLFELELFGKIPRECELVVEANVSVPAIAGATAVGAYLNAKYHIAKDVRTLVRAKTAERTVINAGTSLPATDTYDQPYTNSQT